MTTTILTTIFHVSRLTYLTNVKSAPGHLLGLLFGWVILVDYLCALRLEHLSQGTLVSPFFTRDILSGNAVNFKATKDHTAIYVEEVHEGAHILCFRLINI